MDMMDILADGAHNLDYIRNHHANGTPKTR